MIVDWADQPEAGFLLKRARESAPNRNTVAIAIVDHEPTAADMRDNRLDFLIYRPISAEEADAVLAKACEQMQAPSGGDVAESSGAGRDANGNSGRGDSGLIPTHPSKISRMHQRAPWKRMQGRVTATSTAKLGANEEEPRKR